MIKGKKGENILTENLIFIVLNLIFISILLVFLVSRTGDAAVLEEKYAKQIAMMIDSARPIMEIKLEMEDAFEEANKNGVKGEFVSIDKNVVNVNLRSDGKGYSYSFFNDVKANAFRGSKNKSDENKYIIKIAENE